MGIFLNGERRAESAQGGLVGPGRAGCYFPFLGASVRVDVAIHGHCSEKARRAHARKILLRAQDATSTLRQWNERTARTRASADDLERDGYAKPAPFLEYIEPPPTSGRDLQRNRWCSGRYRFQVRFMCSLGIFVVAGALIFKRARLPLAPLELKSHQCWLAAGSARANQLVRERRSALVMALIGFKGIAGRTANASASCLCVLPPGPRRGCRSMDCARRT